jgi:type II secretory ATPase GspE/PulE/Tfp pilus assembly ATPase PilB-like protein/transcriptional regulator with GAF, ATPase, and Fis domain
METTQKDVNKSIPNSNRDTRLVAILERIKSSRNMEQLLPQLLQDLKQLFESAEVVLLGLDRTKRSLHSVGLASMPNYEVDISVSTLAGYVAATGKAVNFTDPDFRMELLKKHPKLSPLSSLDGKNKTNTKSIMVIPLPYNGKLIGVMEVFNKTTSNTFDEADFKNARDISPALGCVLNKQDESGPISTCDLDRVTGLPPKTEIKPIENLLTSKEILSSQKNFSPEEKLHTLSLALHAAKNTDEILLELKDFILDLFDARIITIYAVDSDRNEIYSKIKSGDRIDEIRVPLAIESIAGWVALEQKKVNITNVHDSEEIKKYHPELKFDNTWDQISGYTTVSMLAYPMITEGKLMGVLQLINKCDGSSFTAQDENFAKVISEVIALAFLNQEKYVQQKPTKFSDLVQNGFISEEELGHAITKARKNRVDVETVLLEDLGLQRKDIGKSMSEFFNLPYYGYSDSIILPKEVLSGLNKSFLAKNYWLPLQHDGTKVVILTNNPSDPDKYQNIKLIFPKKEVEFKIGLKADIVDFLNSITGEFLTESQSAPEAMSSLLSTLQTEQDLAILDNVEELDDGSNFIKETDSAIVRLVNKVLIDAYSRGISDIHFEPGIGKENVVIRFRKDGECSIYEEIPATYKQAIISRIKIMAKLDIAERRMPQDGKIKMKYGRMTIEYRVATCPTVGGNEDAVLRILAASKPLPLEVMSLSPRNLELIKEKVKKPYGLILTVGPTGSGKTTMLHSCLGYINTPNKKIWTAEDPVEITQKGLRQVQMHNKIGLDFSRAMRAFLRGDPDVIMVGEMRDTETASIGLEASLTGHLVFSTLHTNSAPETIVRLLDMGMNPLNFADAMLLVIAQRLVRTLCKDCREEYNPSKDEFDLLVEEYGEAEFKKLDITYDNNLKLKKAVGCNKCIESGYSGRMALHELLDGTQTMKRMIMKREPAEELRLQAMADGMTTLKQDGIIKIFQGHCDLKQVLSVCSV